MSKYPHLFSDMQVGCMRVKNRIVMPAIATSYANLDGTTNEKQRAHYLERARGGTGLIIVEGSAVDFPNERSGRRQPGISMEVLTPEWHDLIESVQALDTKIMLQITHNGFKANPQNNYGAESVTASLAPQELGAYPARQLTIGEIERLVEKFASAAEIAASCGFDGVEIHAGHAYLINQFLSPLTNVRDDMYGGTMENRARFLLEIIKAVRQTCGNSFAIGVRLAVKDEELTDGMKIEEGANIAAMCEQAGADFINCTYGFTSERFKGQLLIRDPRPEYGKKIKEKLKHALVGINGMLQSAEDCERYLTAGVADFVCIGRQLLCDPYWPEKSRMGNEEEIRTCLYCNEGCMNLFLAGGRVRCTINPYLGYEDLYGERLLPQIGKHKKIVIIGGGISGMQAAIILKKRGHNVVLVEREARLGGQMIIAAIPPHKERIQKALDWFEGEMKRLEIETYLCTAANAALIQKLLPDVVLLATGSEPAVPPIEGIAAQKNAWSVLLDEENAPTGKNIVIIGGGTVGCETAEWLLGKNNRITVIEMQNDICIGQEKKYQTYMRSMFLEQDVTIRLNCSVFKVEDKCVHIRNEEDKDESIICDMVITATGQKPSQTWLLSEIHDTGIKAYTIGDATEAANFRFATRSALEHAICI